MVIMSNFKNYCAISNVCLHTQLKDVKVSPTKTVLRKLLKLFSVLQNVAQLFIYFSIQRQNIQDVSIYMFVLQKFHIQYYVLTALKVQFQVQCKYFFLVRTLLYGKNMKFCIVFCVGFAINYVKGLKSSPKFSDTYCSCKFQ